MRRPRTWDEWRVLCGYLALTAAAIWALKFALVALFPDSAIAEALYGVLIPILGSLAVLVIGSGFVAPLVRGRRWWIAVPLAIVSAFVFTIVANGIVYDHVDRYLGDHASSQLVQDEGAVLATVAVLALAALLLLLPSRISRSASPAV
jgi:hypothetical protein